MKDVLFNAASAMGRRRWRLLERQPRSGSKYVFPSPRDPGRPLYRNLSLWYLVRKEAGIEDVRIHDLRHTFASHAVLRGIPLPVVSRLLGHKRPSMTLRYAHVGDRETEAAAERIGRAIAQELEGQCADDMLHIRNSQVMLFADQALHKPALGDSLSLERC